LGINYSDISELIHELLHLQAEVSLQQHAYQHTPY
jgi:hypothetical protein